MCATFEILCCCCFWSLGFSLFFWVSRLVGGAQRLRHWIHPAPLRLLPLTGRRKPLLPPGGGASSFGRTFVRAGFRALFLTMPVFLWTLKQKLTPPPRHGRRKDDKDVFSRFLLNDSVALDRWHWNAQASFYNFICVCVYVSDCVCACVRSSLFPICWLADCWGGGGQIHARALFRCHFRFSSLISLITGPYGCFGLVSHVSHCLV